ncbi:hypothetical protein GC194_05835 [bacterium]|nr:hypothetical protein [bacterium]
MKKLATLNNEQAALIHVYSGSKAYVPGREEEIFRMMEAGAVKTDHVMYDLIDHLYRNMKA